MSATAENPPAENPEDYGLAKQTVLTEIPAPDLPYLPTHPAAYNPPIGLIGCGGITQHHLKAYRNAGFRVVALCDQDRARAEQRRARFYPEADVYTDTRDLLRRDDIEVVDIASHPSGRVALIEGALDARKHVLSQKPFVLDLDVGERLADLADARGTLLAVNQNGRWAPHFSWLREAVKADLIGETSSVSFTLNWDHSWIEGTEYERIHHIILYDFAIHWFDINLMFFPGRRPRRVTAAVSKVPGQTIKVPMLAKVLIEWEDGLANYSFNAVSAYGQSDRTLLVGNKGTLLSEGPDLGTQQVTLYTTHGYCRPKLEGTWFPDGFHGTMGELLHAIDEKRAPSHSARNNLASLEVAFAALASADTGDGKKPGEVRRIE